MTATQLGLDGVPAYPKLRHHRGPVPIYGPREPLKVRVDVDLAEKIRTAAYQRGESVSALCARLIQAGAETMLET